MSNSVQRIDHVIAVVEHFEMARRVWIEAGCPVIYDGTMPTHRACCVSIGSINLELLSAEAFDGWPALASWCAQAGRRFGLQAVALDPGDLDATVTALRQRGLAVSAPREGHLVAPAQASPAALWRNSYCDGLAGLLPGLPSFLCEFVSPRAHLGRSAPDSPLQLVELSLRCADPEAVVQVWQRVVEATHLREGDGYVVRLGLDTGRAWAGPDGRGGEQKCWTNGRKAGGSGAGHSVRLTGGVETAAEQATAASRPEVMPPHGEWGQVVPYPMRARIQPARCCRRETPAG